MVEEPVRKILKNVGLTEKETDVYIFLAKHGALKGAMIAKLTRIDKAETYRILRSLQAKGLLEATLEAPTRFLTIPFNKVLDSYIKSRRDEATFVESAKEDLLHDWAKISRTRFEPSADKFVVVEGESKIYAKIFQLLKEAKSQVLLAATGSDLIRAEQYGLFDDPNLSATKSKVKLHLLTELAENNVNVVKTLLRAIHKSGFDFHGKIPDLGLRLSPRLVAKDNEEILFFTTPKGKTQGTNRDEVCLWTNCRTLVQSLTHEFEEMWDNSTDINRKIVQVETGKPSSQTHIMFDTENIKEKYNEALRSARDEVVVMTSTKGLIEFLNDSESLRRRKGARKAAFRIMAPIVSENLESCRRLSKYCEVRHVSVSYMTTAVIDGRSLFQFKNPEFTEVESVVLPPFETSFYSDDLPYVERAKSVLSAIWNKSRKLPTVRLKSVESSPKVEVNPLSELCGKNSAVQTLSRIETHERGTLTEKEIVDKIIHAKRVLAKDPLRDMNVQYGSYGRAVIHPPSYFNLPDIVIHVWNCNKQSSWGAEDWLDVYLWLETTKGYAYVPVAHVTDNPKVAEFRRGVWAGTPAAQNVMVVKKNMLQVRIQGNTLFAGWTMPIPLYPRQYVLPPCCLLFEGYGKVSPSKTKTSLPSGKTQVFEANNFEAFVTFFHPSSKYSGPGTDGVFTREFIMTAYPPHLKK